MKMSPRRDSRPCRFVSKPPAAAERLEPRQLLTASQGTLDPFYGSDNGIAAVAFAPNETWQATNVLALPDGRAYVTAVLGQSHSALARLTIDGNLDPTFGTGGQATIPWAPGTPDTGLAVQQDGKIVVGSSAYDFVLARYNPDGTLDATFGAGGTDGDGVVTTNAGFAYGRPTTDHLAGLLYQPDGKIVVYGDSGNGNHPRATLARYNPNGTLDGTFGSGGIVVSELGPLTGGGIGAYSGLRSGLLLPNGQLQFAGSVGPGRAVLARYNANGTLDATFGGRGLGVAYDETFPHRGFNAMAAAPGGGFYLLGASSVSAAVARWDANGTWDRSFGGPGGYTQVAESTVYGGAIAVQPDGTILAAQVQQLGRALVGMTPDGKSILFSSPLSLNSSYSFSTVGLALQPDGRALVTGGAYSYPSDLPRYGALVWRYRSTPDAPKGARLDAGIVYVTGDDGPNDVAVLRAGQAWTVTIDGAVQTFPAAAAGRVDLRLLGGNDTLTVADGVPPGMIDLGDGDDTARLAAGALKLFGGGGDDRLEFSPHALPAGAPAAVPTPADGGPGTDTLAVVGGAGEDLIRLLQGSVQLPGQSVAYTAVERLNVDGGAGNDRVDLDDSAAAAGSPKMPATVEGGPGNDLFRVTRAPAGTLQDFRGGGDDDRLVATAITAANLNLRFAAGDGVDSARVESDPNSVVAEQYALGDDRVTKNGGFVLAFADPALLEAIEVDAGAGDDAFTNARTAAGRPATLTGGTGRDSYVTSVALLPVSTDVTFDGGGDVGDAATLLDPDAAPHAYELAAGVIRRDGTPMFRHAGLDRLALTVANGGADVAVTSAAGLASLTVTGGSGNDVFRSTPASPLVGLGADVGGLITFYGGPGGRDEFQIVPDPAAAHTVGGSAPGDGAALDDRLAIGFANAGTGARLNWTGAGRGRYTFDERAPVYFGNIGSLNDLPSPAAATSGFRPDLPQSLTFTFATDVDPATVSLVLRDLRTDRLVPAERVAYAYDPAARTATFTFPGYPDGRLPDGDYRGYLPAGTVAAVGRAGQPGAVMAADFSIDFAVRPRVRSVVVNDGSAQRSMVTGLTVTFDEAVVPAAGAFTLAYRFGKGTPGVTANVVIQSSDRRSFTLAFGGGGVSARSLADAAYLLRVSAAGVRGAGGLGLAMAADATFAFHRLFGDGDGDGDVDNADLFQLRRAYNKPPADPSFKWYLDYEGDGDIDNADLFQVRGRTRVTFKGY